MLASLLSRGVVIEAFAWDHAVVSVRKLVVLGLTATTILTAVGCSAAGQWGTISGVVEIRNGGVSLCANCTHPYPGQVQFLHHGVAEQTITTATDGRFSVTLPAGRYVVRTSRRCAAPPKTIQLRAGQAVHVRLLCFNAIG